MKAAAKENIHWGRAARAFWRCATTIVATTIVLALLWSPVLGAEQATTLRFQWTSLDGALPEAQ
ncbi:MAG: hypothetical protein JRC67_10215 [Deltaproteobacteria bacterium]|nr:hypothetical protein [Deltaproteobacteria bacterium]